MREAILDQFLTENEAVSDEETLSCVFLFTQMGELSKALNLINLLGHADYAILALKAHLYQRTGYPAEAQASARLAIDLFEKKTTEQTLTANRWIQASRIWAEAIDDPISLYLASIENRVNNGDLNGALNEVRQCLAQFGENEKIMTLAMNLAYLTGDEILIPFLIRSVFRGTSTRGNR